MSVKGSTKRLHMKKRQKYHQTNKARYALKRMKVNYLKDSLKKNSNSDAYVQAARDLSLEAEILASLNHPNIIKLRGTTHSGAAGFRQGPGGYFLIIDRLFETLAERMKSWRELHKSPAPNKKGRRRGFAFGGRSVALQESESDQRLNRSGALELTNEIMDERLSVALQIAAALEYLHCHFIIFRDLKPANIGFDVRGDVKIFDFGLARIVPRNDRGPYKETFKMSGAGSPRYMAPECLSGEKYNMKADVYSFAVLLWEMMAGRTPYAFARTMNQLAYYVVDDGGRPDIDEGWPLTIKNMLESSFDSDVEKRPQMKSVYDGIKNTLTCLRGRDCPPLTDSFIHRRRSVRSSRSSFLSDVTRLDSGGFDDIKKLGDTG